MKANEGTEEIMDELESAADEAQDLLEGGNPSGEKLRTAKARLASAMESARDAYRKIEEKAVAGAKATDRAIRDYPYQSMGIAFAAGLLIGVLVTRRNR